MDTNVSLESLGIHWKGKLKELASVPRDLLPKCSVEGIVKDAEGKHLFKLIPHASLGKGTFGFIDAFYKEFESGERKLIAIKRPKTGSVDLFLEALIQWKTHEDLIPYGLSGSVPKVYDIFFHRPSSSVWFTMDSFDPVLFSVWCSSHIPKQTSLFPYILLQIALLLEVFEEALRLDHRDLKVNNILIVKESFSINIRWNHSDKTIIFPFRVVFIDFGFACIGKEVDVRDGLPSLDTCPKMGRDFFHILVSLWTIPSIREALESQWGAWVRERIYSASGSSKIKDAYIRLTESSKDLEWLHSATNDPGFKAPLCAPKHIISECMRFIEVV